MLVPQLSCGSAGNTYPSENIDQFIDNNKALIRRMYGELQEPRTKTTVRVVRTYRQERQRCSTSATFNKWWTSYFPGSGEMSSRERTRNFLSPWMRLKKISRTTEQ